jgi:hypothetical protein
MAVRWRFWRRVGRKPYMQLIHRDPPYRVSGPPNRRYSPQQAQRPGWRTSTSTRISR